MTPAWRTSRSSSPSHPSNSGSPRSEGKESASNFLFHGSAWFGFFLLSGWSALCVWGAWEVGRRQLYEPKKLVYAYLIGTLVVVVLIHGVAKIVGM
jgi:hypothetical protein